MAQRRDRARLGFESRPAIGAMGAILGKRPDADGPIEPPVAGRIDLAHPSDPDEGLDLVRSESRPGRERHRRRSGLAEGNLSEFPAVAKDYGESPPHITPTVW